MGGPAWVRPRPPRRPGPGPTRPARPGLTAGLLRRAIPPRCVRRLRRSAVPTPRNPCARLLQRTTRRHHTPGFAGPPATAPSSSARTPSCSPKPVPKDGSPCVLFPTADTAWDSHSTGQVRSWSSLLLTWLQTQEDSSDRHRTSRHGNRGQHLRMNCAAQTVLNGVRQMAPAGYRMLPVRDGSRGVAAADGGLTTTRTRTVARTLGQGAARRRATVDPQQHTRSRTESAQGPANCAARRPAASSDDGPL